MRRDVSAQSFPAPFEDRAQVVSLERPTQQYRLLPLNEIIAMKPPQYLIKGFLIDGGLATISGPPGSGKSFVALDMALCVALDRHWQDRATKSGSAVYIAGEGVGGMPKRVRAWLQHHHAEGGAEFTLIAETVNLLDHADVAKIVNTLEPIAPIALTVIDTLARCYLGGDENSAEDMGRFIAACDRIRAATRGALLVVHHSSKGEGRGLRGSTALLGAVDTSLEVSGAGGYVTLKVGKQKDDDLATDLHMRMVPVDLGEVDGEPVASCVLQECEPPKAFKRAKLTPKQRDILDVVAGAGGDGLSNVEWKNRVMANEITGREETYIKARQKLAELGLIEQHGDRWLAVQN